MLSERRRRCDASLGDTQATSASQPGENAQRRSWCSRWRRSRSAVRDDDEEWGIGPSRFSSFCRESLELRWEQLSMSVTSGSRKLRKTTWILKGVGGVAKPGLLTCVLGPSGSGKTTLLNVLAGRQSGGARSRVQLTGMVWAAGKRIDPRMFRSRIAYVMQKDEMFATATPREALRFSAALRHSGGHTEGHDKLITELLGSLGLLRCADTFIGNAVINGVSGGQRKRTAIGVELITRPEIVCLDEPTSGLDSYAAYQVVRVLKDLAAAGCTVICTLHQPSSEIFALVDHVICICSGHCLYEGPRDAMVAYLSSVGHPCPVGFNPADFVIFLVQTVPRESLEFLIQHWHQERPKGPSAKPAATNNGTASVIDCATPLLGTNKLPSDPRFAPTPQKPFGQQLLSLIVRELRSVRRDRTTLGVRFCLSVVLALLFGLIFQGVGRTILEKGEQTMLERMWTGLSTEELRALRKQKLEWHFNAIVQVAMVAMFSACQPTILAFPLERQVFLREHSGGAYGVLPYYLSKMAVEVPLVFVQSLLTLSICYVTMELNGDFWRLLLTMVLLSVCSVSVALAIGCMVRLPRETGAAGPLVFVPQMLFSGVFIPVKNIPSC